MNAKAQARQAKTKAARESATATAAAPALDPERLAHLNDRNLEVAMRMGHALFDGAANMNQEFINFLNRRLQEDMRTAQKLCDCRNPTEFVDAELRFLQTLVQHYAENTNRMLGIASDMLRTEIHDVEEAVAEMTKPSESDAA